MQYPIPQFIEEEGRIVFFMTFRQFFLLVGGGAFCMILFYLLPFWIFVAIAIPFALIIAAVAFLKIDNESIVKIVLHFIGFSMGQRNYIWRKKELSYAPKVSVEQKSNIGEIKKIIETKK